MRVPYIGAIPPGTTRQGGLRGIPVGNSKPRGWPWRPLLACGGGGSELINSVANLPHFRV